MAKTASSLVLPIIFLVMFSLVEQNMGCGRYIGPCDVIGYCDRACKFVFGPASDGICDISGTKQCACRYPCPPAKIRM
ncbi:hypothetical protein EUTSA_v10028327mg [Eutrema salsugineum]|uniref:Defensin-like protein n=1 Tax=Eutrema salsugineum TaxID=72664 RepID=V4NLM7_EUTSA|nr:hypothetical protein EUTSA_v10028327mg [Eutrema salsugineum]